jgi:circadian clock protein KaiB
VAKAMSAADRMLMEFEQALVELATAPFDLTLFINGASSLSARAVADVRALCEAHLPGRYQLSVVDVNHNPEEVASRGVLASPTLIKDSPLPKRVLVGNLSNTSQMLLVLGIEPAAPLAGSI